MKGKNLLVFVCTVIMIVGISAIAYFGFGPAGQGSAKDINLGLDLAGGVSITYTTDKADPTTREIGDTIYKLQKRISEQGYTEGEVYKEGTNRINVDIPSVKDPNQVLQELGKPGNLEFRDESGKVVISGEDIKDATPLKDDQSLDGGYYIRLELTATGTEKFATATTANVGKIIYIYYNDVEIMSPRVQVPITDGVASITGMSGLEQASDIATTIRIGALPLKLVELRSNVVGAKMGEEAIHTSLFAGLVGMILLFIFLIAYYRVPGLSAFIALVFYAALMVVILSLTDATLTLPGIAGIILSIGMAVDANVLIFARLKEELSMDKTLRASVKSAFTKASSAIVDSNVTTLIAAAVLFFMGTGTIKGFALTLGIGILVSMFTALVVTRILLNGFIAAGIKNKIFFGKFHIKRDMKIVENTKIWFSISIIIILVGLVFLPINKATHGNFLNYDVEFAGGTSTLVDIPTPYDSYEALEKDIATLVVEATGDKTPTFNNVNSTDDKGHFVIKTNTLSTEARIKLEQALIAKYGITNESIQSESISPTVGNEMKRMAIFAVIVASLGILLYVSYRFKDFSLGVSSIVALLHDVLVMMTVYIVMYIPINNSFIAAILTIIGYSINDTVVVFDRIRENHKHMKRGDYKGLINSSVTQTFGRSIATSMTVFIMVLVLHIFGVPAMRELTLPLMVGVLSGTYSSIFNASPIWYLFKKHEEKKIATAQSKI